MVGVFFSFSRFLSLCASNQHFRHGIANIHTLTFIHDDDKKTHLWSNTCRQRLAFYVIFEIWMFSETFKLKSLLNIPSLFVLNKQIRSENRRLFKALFCFFYWLKSGIGEEQNEQNNPITIMFNWLLSCLSMWLTNARTWCTG